MAEPVTKLPVKVDTVPARRETEWHPFDNLRREVDRLFEDFGFWRGPRRSLIDLEPRWPRAWDIGSPAVDVVENDKAYEVTAELPGLDEKSIDVRFANGTLTIMGEKTEEREEKKKDYYVSERSYGSFRRAFQVPDGVDTDKIGASFKNGVLTVTLPKSPEAQKTEKKIPVTAAR